MLATGQDFSFVVLKQSLAGKRMTKFDHRFDDLTIYKNQIEIVRLVRKFKLQDHPDLNTLVCQLDPNAYCRKAVELLLADIPYEEVEDELYVVPELQGLNGVMEDDIDEILNTERPYRDSSLFNFMLFLLEPDYVEDNFAVHRDFYKWPMKTLPEFPDENFWKVDHDAAKQYLVDVGCEEMCGAVDFFFGETYTLFFDLTPEDEGLYMPVNEETILKLREDWELTRPVMDAFKQAEEAVDRDPQLIGAFYNSLVYGLAKGKGTEK